MAVVTVGIPVYNGAADLAGTLDCILGQTYRDIEVLVFDNASSDQTPQIVADYAARDPRVRYLRQPVNKGPVPNFKDVILAADSPYFMWRAADDRSDANFIAVLLNLLETHPDKQLAVGRIVHTYQGRTVHVVEPLALDGRGGWRDRIKLMFKANASMIYGLYRRPAMAAIMAKIGDRYGEPAWGWDFVALLPFFLGASIVQTDATSFQFGVRGAPRPPGQARGPRKEADFDAMLGARARFLTLARELIRERRWPGVSPPVGEVLVWAYANQRVYKVKRIIRRGLRRWVGLTP